MAHHEVHHDVRHDDDLVRHGNDDDYHDDGDDMPSSREQIITIKDIFSFYIPLQNKFSYNLISYIKIKK